MKLTIAAKLATTSDSFRVIAFVHYLNARSSLEGRETSISITSVSKLSSNVELQIAGETIVGSNHVMKRLLGEFPASRDILGKDDQESAEILARIRKLLPLPTKINFMLLYLKSLSLFLTLRTFLVGHRFTLADWTIWFALRENALAVKELEASQDIDESSGFQHVHRWFSLISHLFPGGYPPSQWVAQIESPAQACDVGKASNRRAVNPSFHKVSLRDAVMGQVVTRFPPEPSGYLHIGHAKAAFLNAYFADLYQGRFLIRFDDTNPVKEKAEFEAAIIEDLELLGFERQSPSYTSDYFDQLYALCVRMIKEGKAYADDTPHIEMGVERRHAVASKHRDMSPDESLSKFEEMASGSEEGKRWCIRAKISVDDPNQVMRDPVIYRVVVDKETGEIPSHQRTGLAFKAYPTYEFACPVVDSLEGVTHALRTDEYRERNVQYAWMLSALGLKKIEVWDYAKIEFAYTKLSKRDFKQLIEIGLVRGWDDPRLATVRGIRRRGMTIEALKQYMLMQGPSQAVTNLEWDSIWTVNKRIIDPVAPRYVALDTAGLVKVTLSGEGTPSAPEMRPQPRHKKNPDVGTKQTVYADVIYIEQEDAKSFDDQEEITLMDWGNAFVRNVTHSAEGVVTSIAMELHLEGDFKKTKKKITWLSNLKSPSSPEGLTPLVLLDYDYLISKKKLEEDDNFTDFLTPVTEFRVPALGDHNVGSLKKGDIIQFERKGYYIIDKPAGVKSDVGNRDEDVECILIPDGKASSIVSKATPPPASKPVAPAAPSKKSQKKAAAAAAEGRVGNEAGVGAAVPIKKAGPSRIPDPAPQEPVETVLLSDVVEGFEQKVTTKMYRVPNIYGDDGVPAKATTKMHDVKKVY